MSLSSTNEAASAVHVLSLQNYVQIAGFVFTFYDHVITFDQEIELIWKKRWSKSRTLYFFCRYFGNILVFWHTYVYMFQRPTDKVSLVGMRTNVAMAAVSTWISQYILQSRVLALYQSDYVSRFLYVAFCVEVIGLLIFTGLSIPKLKVTSQPFPGVYHCTFTEVPSYNFMFWVSVMLFDTILFILALGLIYKWWFQPPLEETLRLRCSCPTLVVILLRDNLGHCFSAFALYTITVVVCLTTDASYASIPPSFIYAVTTVMGTRLILNLCDAFHNPSTNNQSRESCEWDAAVSCFTCVPPVVFAPMPINDAAMT
ncbi:hypothetical protein Agabi119p4_4758 [Agaricus bisporus var. burnettii]|uniref:DUF6533 domain-containing protein n=1 Tax=Agaricus bisporus var. burnettii TaxID=192524 RepID=A0A8H7F420_AGABI|nr:hypothetical protein Agabi119p4_4758 [Agaricus bisporus var. burnettii]